MSPLVSAVNPVIPSVGVAVKVIVSDFEYTGVEIVTSVPPMGMMPVSVPLSVPPPEAWLKVTVVSLDTGRAVPPESRASTVTLIAVPAVPVAGTVL